MVLMMEQIQQFLSYPQLPDLIAYILAIGVFIVQIFVKKFVKKDNQNTTFIVDTKIKKLNKLEKELEEDRKRLAEEKKALEESRKALVKEMDKIKQSIRLSANNTKDLVSSGIANQIDKMLPLESEETIADIKVETLPNKEENKND